MRERNFVGDRLEDVESEAAENCEIGGAIILSGPGIIFADQNIELPVQFVFDAPMGSDSASAWSAGKRSERA